MSFDALLKKYFSVWVCGLISAAAYFQAAGVGSLVVGTMGQSASANVASASHHARPTSATTALKNAEPILARNAFDSVTGPLNGKLAPPGEGEPPPPVTN